jgi:UDP-GlcNAc3NAcA epimerase
MTDSGGLQKEAFFFGKFCITMRDQTEWVELVENGFNIITGASKSKILNAYKDSINKSANFSIDLYGGGKAAQNIVKALKTL